MKAFVAALFFMPVHRLPNFDHYFSHDWVFAVPTIQKLMFLPETDSGTCGRIFIWLTVHDNLLLLMRAMISCTNYGLSSMS